MGSINFCKLTMVLFLTEFDPEDCPLDCSRPCEIVCPANAISLEEEKSTAEVSNGTNTLNILKVF